MFSILKFFIVQCGAMETTPVGCPRTVSKPSSCRLPDQRYSGGTVALVSKIILQE